MKSAKKCQKNEPRSRVQIGRTLLVDIVVFYTAGCVGATFECKDGPFEELH